MLRELESEVEDGVGAEGVTGWTYDRELRCEEERRPRRKPRSKESQMPTRRSGALRAEHHALDETFLNDSTDRKGKAQPGGLARSRGQACPWACPWACP